LAVMNRKLLVAVAVAFTLNSRVFAHGEEDHRAYDHGAHSMSGEAAFGHPADSRLAARAIRIEMRDPNEFSPSQITIKTGEVIRFEVVNTGKHMHEMVLGTMKELDEHNEMMKTRPGMRHEDPGMVQLQPGKSGVIVWQFTKPGEFYFGCLVEDHFDLGMTGKIQVSGEPVVEESHDAMGHSHAEDQHEHGSKSMEMKGVMH
jgi:uncharacterized cupredoxin-like copper-binding protein